MKFTQQKFCISLSPYKHQHTPNRITNFSLEMKRRITWFAYSLLKRPIRLMHKFNLMANPMYPCTDLTRSNAYKNTKIGFVVFDDNGGCRFWFSLYSYTPLHYSKQCNERSYWLRMWLGERMWIRSKYWGTMCKVHYPTYDWTPRSNLYPHLAPHSSRATHTLLLSLSQRRAKFLFPLHKHRLALARTRDMVQ